MSEGWVLGRRKRRLSGLSDWLASVSTTQSQSVNAAAAATIFRYKAPISVVVE